MYSPKIDICISEATTNLQPLISYLRELIHTVYPEIEENIKWNYPSFEINKKIIFTIMIFKNHINFVFYNGIQINDNYNVLVKFGEKTTMKGFKHLKHKTELPNKKILVEYILEATNNL